MKRSEINQIIVEAEAFLEEHKFHLPPWAKWGLSEWKDNIDNVSEITDNMLGWDITDFGDTALVPNIHDSLLDLLKRA